MIRSSRGIYLLTVGTTLEGLAICFILLYLVEKPAVGIIRVLAHPVLVKMGVFSYSLYVWQELFLYRGNPTFSGTFPVNVFFCFITATASRKLIGRALPQDSRSHQSGDLSHASDLIFAASNRKGHVFDCHISLFGQTSLSRPQRRLIDFGTAHSPYQFYSVHGNTNVAARVDGDKAC